MLMIKELSGIQIGNWIVKYVYFMFLVLANVIFTSWMHLYQIDLSPNKEFFFKKETLWPFFMDGAQLPQGILFFTTKFPDIPGTHFIDLRRMKG